MWVATGWVARRRAGLGGAACGTGAGVSSHLCRGCHHEQPERELCTGLSEENPSWGGRGGN